MNNQIFLTSPINNEHGFVDFIQSITESRKNEGELNAIIDSPGGEIFGGFRIARAISEHPTKTIAHVRGIAASMAGVLLAFFDKVTIDENSTIMLHQAQIRGSFGEEISDSYKKVITDFNNLASNLLKKRGMNQELLNEIFKGKPKDFWFTANQAKEAGIVDEVTKVVRKNGTPSIKIAAALENSKNNYNQYINRMSLFRKKQKPENTEKTVQSGEIEGGIQFVFNSKENSIAVGNSVARIGSDESLEGTHKLVDGRKLVINANQEVSEIEEGSEISEIMDRLSKIEDRLSKIEDRDDLPTSKEVEDLTASFNNYISAMKSASNGTGFKIPKAESKENGISINQSNASLASEMRGVIKAIGKEQK